MEHLTKKKERYPEYKGDRPASTSLVGIYLRYRKRAVERYAKDMGYKFIREAGCKQMILYTP